MQNLDKLGGTAFPHTSVDPKTNDVIYHPGMPLWAWFLGQALAANTTSGSARNVIEYAESIADEALEAYLKRLAPPEEEPKPHGLAWEHFGHVSGLGGEPLHIWKRGWRHKPQCTVTASQEIEPVEGCRIFARLEELVSYHRIHPSDMDEFVRRFVKAR